MTANLWGSASISAAQFLPFPLLTVEVCGHACLTSRWCGAPSSCHLGGAIPVRTVFFSCIEGH